MMPKGKNPISTADNSLIIILVVATISGLIPQKLEELTLEGKHVRFMSNHSVITKFLGILKT